MSATSAQVADRILHIIPLMMRTLAAELRQTGHTLSPSHFRLLAMLYERKWSLGELAQHDSVSPPTISRTISTLEERGWVVRSTSPEDGRVVLAELTPRGKAVLEDMHAKAQAWLAEELDKLERAEREQLMLGLEILSDVVFEKMAQSGMDPEESMPFSDRPKRSF